MPNYDLTIRFRSAERLMIGDLASRTSDPYVVATLHTNYSDRDPDHSPPLRFRTHTVPDTVDPAWECAWHVSNVPREGSRMRVQVFDEDIGGHDDVLGHVIVDLSALKVWEVGRVDEQAYKLRKRHADKKATVMNFLSAGWAYRDGTGRNEKVVISVRVNGLTPQEKTGGLLRAFTTGPNYWSKHYSPLIGKMVGNHDLYEHKPESLSFEGTKIQLTGPLPETLSHDYVEFAPFVTSYFTKRGLRGRLLYRALHHQYNNIYSHDRATQYGCIVDSPPTTKLTKKFLELAHWREPAKLFTYVITLDAQWRFTETGDEFAIDLLSKHSLHSDVSPVVAYSGEFFIRRTSTDKRIRAPVPSDEDLPFLELVIDNDSGTYRPKKELLPELESFLRSNLPGLAIATYDCFNEELIKLKKHQKEMKERFGRRRFMQRKRHSVDSSISSSDEEALEGRKKDGIKQKIRKRVYGTS